MVPCGIQAEVSFPGFLVVTLSSSSSRPPPFIFFSLCPSAFNGAALTAAKPASSSMKMSFETEIGAQAPIGYWDPLGLLTREPTQVRRPSE